MKIREFDDGDLAALTAIYAACFPREKMHEVWLNANIQSFPRSCYYVAEIESRMVGYAQWTVKSGFRDKSIIELEQLAVLPDQSGKGIGKTLLAASYEQFLTHLSGFEITAKAVYVTTRCGNFAEALYKEVLGVERQGVIVGYGSGDEAILFKHLR